IEYRVVAIEVHDGTVGKDLAHAGSEARPGTRVEEAVAEQEAATQQVVAQLGGHLVTEIPVSCQARHEEGPVEHIVAVVEVDGLFHGTGVDGAEAAQQGNEGTVTFRIIDSPTRAPQLPVAPAHAA